MKGKRKRESKLLNERLVEVLGMRAQGMTLRSIAEKTGMSSMTVWRWIRESAQSAPITSCGKRAQMLKEHLDEVLSLNAQGLSIRDIEEKTGVSKSAISRWIAKFADPKQKQDKPTMEEPKSISSDALDSHSLEEQVAMLKEALLKAELRGDLYDEMIRVAEAKFNVKIRKKAGAKQ